MSKLNDTQLANVLNRIPWESHQAIRAHIDALQSEVAGLRRKLRQEYGGMLDEQEALRAEVARLRHYADDMALKYCEIRDSKNAENARLREALEIATSESCECAIVGGLSGKPYREAQCNRCMRIERIKQSPVPSQSGETDNGP